MFSILPLSKPSPYEFSRDGLPYEFLRYELMKLQTVYGWTL